MDETTTKVMSYPPFITITMGFIVFFIGVFLTRKISFLKNFNIPEPVSGGLAVALFTWFCYAFFNTEITFDLSVRDELLVVFFATIGLNAQFADLLRGGKLLLTLLFLTIIFMLLQNSVGLLGTILFDLPKSISALLGSASLIGGHGTAIAWGPTIELKTGFEAAEEIGIASATLGLVAAALIGGPIAKFLIDRHQLSSKKNQDPIVGLPYSKEGKEKPSSTKEDDNVNHTNLMAGMLAAHIAVILGYFSNQAISKLGLKLPLFVPCLLVGIIMSNTIPFIFPKLKWPARTRALAVISDYSLSVFLAISLMSMQLWTLGGLGVSLIGVLILQIITTTAFIYFFVFKLMGSNYTAAVLSAGFAGFGLGATPTAIANMSSVTKRYGSAPLAFIILPLVSAFFVDLANAFIIQFFVNL